MFKRALEANCGIRAAGRSRPLEERDLIDNPPCKFALFPRPTRSECFPAVIFYLNSLRAIFLQTFAGELRQLRLQD